MYAVYILYSCDWDKIYIGCTSNLIERFRSHNLLSRKGWTVRYRPWEVIHIEIFDEKLQAMHRERFLKSGQGRHFIKTEILSR